jgi:hypothetical protein
MKPYYSLPILVSSFAAAVLLPAFPSPVSASNGPVLVYNSFGPGGTYSNQRWIVEGTLGSHGFQGHAESFVPGISGYLYQIQLATLVQNGLPFSNVTIAQDNGSGVPGSVLESFTGQPNTINGVVTINSAATPLLQAGQEYWLTDEAFDPTTVTGWYQNNQGLTGGAAFETAGANTWFNLGAAGSADSVFSISVIPAPEPSSAGLLLLASGLFTVYVRRRARRA